MVIGTTRPAAVSLSGGSLRVGPPQPAVSILKPKPAPLTSLAFAGSPPWQTVPPAPPWLAPPVVQVSFSGGPLRHCCLLIVNKNQD
ncbi:hypothetical protein YC2023_054097 [Brassica napus]